MVYLISNQKIAIRYFFRAAASSDDAQIKNFGRVFRLGNNRVQLLGAHLPTFSLQNEMHFLTDRQTRGAFNPVSSRFHPFITDLNR